MRWWKRIASLFFHLLVITGLCLAIFETVRSLYQGFNNVNQSMHWVLNNELYPAPAVFSRVLSKRGQIEDDPLTLGHSCTLTGREAGRVYRSDQAEHVNLTLKNEPWQLCKGPREWRTGSYLTVEGTPPSPPQSKQTSSNDSLSHNAPQSRPMPSVALFMGILPFYDKAKLM
ncbi:uncharacterized protein LOC142356676, partial [Convolutriloba macropyga]|uniref:uncharacterized protein LOC142356676 n=1 Tax=Convolutriloba macropyga TaxID=536237 RepID=UPI003F52803B